MPWGSTASCWRAKGFRHFAEEVVALVVDDDEGREVVHLDLPHGLHAELGILEYLDLGDAVLGEHGCGSADRPEVEAAVRGAGVGDGPGAVALCQHHQRAAVLLEQVDVGVHTPGGSRAERARRVAVRGLGRPRVVDAMVAQVLRHAFARVEARFDLGVGDVTGNDHGAVQHDPRLDGIVREGLPDLRHGLVQVDVHDLGRLEVLVRDLREVPGRVGLELLEKDSLGRDLAEGLAVGRARHRERDGARRAVPGQPDDAHVVTEVLSPELCPDAERLCEREHLPFELTVPKAAAELVAGRGK